MIPPVEESTSPCDELPVERSTATRDYHISLIEARGPNSRGFHMLHARLVGIGKTYVPQPVTTTIPTPY